jgi:hypothetical protein
LSLRRWIFGLAGLALLILGADAFWLEPSSLRVSHYPVPVDLGVGPLKIAVITDLHGGAVYIDDAKIARVVALTNAEKPDLILLPGDFVAHELGASGMPIEEIAAILKGLHARLGVYAVLGNHDYMENAPRIAAALAHASLTVLDDGNKRIVDGRRSFYVAGITDYNLGPHRADLALAHIPKGQHALCFTHSPDEFPELLNVCTLTVAGHTHGGQVSPPFVGPIFTNSRYGRRYVSGVISEGGKTLFVGTGIGTSIIPVRFGVPPEISVLDLP